jgi:hypothetical protein
VKGHVFGQRYWAEPIPTPQYLRRAIVYTHLNPCKATLCEEPVDYEWSSHRRFLALGRGEEPDNLGYTGGLQLFADESCRPEDACANYLKFIEFCQERRRAGIIGDWLLPDRVTYGIIPSATLGDELWAKDYTTFDGGSPAPKKQVDVHGLAVKILRRIDPKLDLDTLRYNRRVKAFREPRAELVCGLLSAEARPGAIARCLLLSPSTVSHIRRRMLESATQKL